MTPAARRAVKVAAAVLLPGGALLGAWWWFMGRAGSGGRSSRWAAKARRDRLSPAMSTKADALLSALDAAGVPVVVTDGFRSSSEQDALYAQGRTAPGSKVTNARGGESAHNFGDALDVAPINAAGFPHWPEDAALWERIGAAGERLGLVWGGRWSTPDRPHFEVPGWRSKRPATGGVVS